MLLYVLPLKLPEIYSRLRQQKHWHRKIEHLASWASYSTRWCTSKEIGECHLSIAIDALPTVKALQTSVDNAATMWRAPATPVLANGHAGRRFNATESGCRTFSYKMYGMTAHRFSGYFAPNLPLYQLWVCTPRRPKNISVKRAKDRETEELHIMA